MADTEPVPKVVETKSFATTHRLIECELDVVETARQSMSIKLLFEKNACAEARLAKD